MDGGGSPSSHSNVISDEKLAYENGHLEKVERYTNNGGSEPEDISPALDRAITRKFDHRIVPWLFGLWLLAFIDRSNIGNAKIDGLVTDLKLDGNKFNVALTVFYVPYILMDIPSNWFLKYVGGGYYLPALIVAWGIVSTCMGLIKSYAGLIVCRCLLGLFEGEFCHFIRYHGSPIVYLFWKASLILV